MCTAKYTSECESVRYVHTLWKSIKWKIKFIENTKCCCWIWFDGHGAHPTAVIFVYTDVGRVVIGAVVVKRYRDETWPRNILFHSTSHMGTWHMYEFHSKNEQISFEHSYGNQERFTADDLLAFHMGWQMTFSKKDRRPFATIENPLFFPRYICTAPTTAGR